MASHLAITSCEGNVYELVALSYEEHFLDLGQGAIKAQVFHSFLAQGSFCLSPHLGHCSVSVQLQFTKKKTSLHFLYVVLATNSFRKTDSPFVIPVRVLFLESIKGCKSPFSVFYGYSQCFFFFTTLVRHTGSRRGYPRLAYRFCVCQYPILQ